VAVQVDDAGLAAFPTIPCVVPRLQRLTLPKVRRTLRRADCRLGKVGLRRVARRARVLRVVKQTPAPRTRHAARYAVGVTLG
jgi:transposase InsO family protein